MKFMLKNSTYLQGSYLWIVSSVAESGYNSPHSSPKASWVALLPPFSSPLLILFAFFDNKSFSTYSSHGQSGSLSFMHSSPSSSSYGLPALYILIPQFPLSPCSFGLFLFLKPSIPASLLSPMSWRLLYTPGLFFLRVIPPPPILSLFCTFSFLWLFIL